MHIAIIDDEQEEINKLQDMITKIHGSDHVDQYLNGRCLLEAVAQGKAYDLVLCDIYMKEENGIDIAKKVKQISPQTPVVFITSSTEHAVDAYSIEAVHYLVKPVSEEDMIEVFRRLEKKMEKRHTLMIQSGRVINVIYQDEIIMLESHGHITEIVCVNQTSYPIRKAFREINGLLDNSFLQIKKGVTLNMNYILRMTYKDCTTRDGKIYLLRRDQAKEIREKYYSFVKNELSRI
jgi:DNA-binding LytR/AlgR family response regulator